MEPWTGALPYFPEHEIRCRGTGIIRVDPRFAALLCGLRAQWGAPLYPTSFCRTPEHNRQVQGHPRSLHLTSRAGVENDRVTRVLYGTCAADLYWADWTDTRKHDFARVAWSHGLSVGLHPAFMHVDARTLGGLMQTVFTYSNWGGEFDPDAVMQ